MYFVVEIETVAGWEKYQATLDCGASASAGYKVAARQPPVHPPTAAKNLSLSPVFCLQKPDP